MNCTNYLPPVSHSFDSVLLKFAALEQGVAGFLAVGTFTGTCVGFGIVLFFETLLMPFGGWLVKTTMFVVDRFIHNCRQENNRGTAFYNFDEMAKDWNLGQLINNDA